MDPKCSQSGPGSRQGVFENQQTDQQSKKRKRKHRYEKTHIYVLMCGDFLQKWRVQRLGAGRRLMKTSDKYVVENIAQRNATQTENKPIPIEPTMSQRHNNYHGVVRSRVAKRSLGVIRCNATLKLLWAKMASKRCPFENLENRKGHPKPIVFKSLALGPSKNSSRERL